MKPIDVEEFLKSGLYLPPPLRDFHDQKDAFKAMHELVNVQKHEYCGDVGWMKGQCYVIDVFLWFMARRGYTLQRVRRPGNFRDLHADVEAARVAREKQFTVLIDGRGAANLNITTQP